MTLVSHEVMGDNRLVSDDGCVKGEGDSQPPGLRWVLGHHQKPKTWLFKTWPEIEALCLFPFATSVYI